MREPYPLLVERRLSRRLWGGSRLAGYLGIEDGSGVGGEVGQREPIAESWQVYADNTILNGPLAELTLRQVAATEGASFIGTAGAARYGATVPLLAKFIDAGRPLSIQVHPDDDYARVNESESGHLGKAEAWYILAAAADAEIVWGFRETMTPETVRQAVEAGELQDFVNHIPVAAGDVIYNPEGTVHAIGAGLFLFEIQQASDLTYRLYDYDRRGVDGLPRTLHVERALEVANLESGSLAKVAPLELGRGRRLLVESRHFVMEAVIPDLRASLATSPVSLEFLTVTRGDVSLIWRTGEMKLPTGTSVVLPASLGEYQLEGSAEVIRCYLPVG